MTQPADQDQDDAEAPRQRLLSAADSSPLYSAAASSVFNWRGAGAAAVPAPRAAAAPPATEQPTEETMATSSRKRPARARKSTGSSPQLQICRVLLLKNRHLSRDGIAEACGELSAAQISSALNNAKAHKRVELVEDEEAGKVFRLTKAGAAWVTAATSEQPSHEAKPQKRGAAGRKSAHRRAREPKAQEVDTRPPTEEEPTEATFRCAVMSDGCFFISKGDVSLELTAEEHKQMLHYQERMAVDA